MPAFDGRALLGRRAELDLLREALAERRVASIAGAPGIGKSALAGALCGAPVVRVGGSRLVPLRVDLAGARSGPELARRVALALGQGSDMNAPARLAAHRRLVVLDDADECLDLVAGLVEAWRPWATGSACVVTAAAALPHTRAAALRLGPLAVPDAGHDPSRVAAVPAVALLLEALWRRDARRAFTAADRAAAASIARRVDGVPLALELASARAYELGLSWVDERLARGVDHLRATERDVPARHQSLDAATARAWAALHPEDAARARLLATLSGPFDRDAAAAVSGLDVDAATALVATLVEGGVLEVVASEDGVRHRMLHLFRAGALEPIAPRARAQARAALVRHWARSSGARAEWVIVRSDARDRAERTARTDAFLDAVALGMTEEARALFVALAPGYLAEGPLDRLLELVRRAEALPRERAWSGTVSFFEALTLLFLGKPKDALASLRAAERDAPRPLAALALSYRGVILGLGGDLSRGERACRRAEATLEGAPPELLGRALKNTANVLAEKGSGLVLDLLVRAEACFRSAGDPREEAFVRMLRLSQLVDEGDLDAGAQMGPDVLARLDVVGDRRTLAWTHGLLGILEQERGAFGHARELLGRAEAGARAVGDHHTAGMMQYYAARLDLEQGDLGGVCDRCVEARALLEPAGDLGHLALVEATLACAHRLAGREDAARATASRARALLPRSGRAARRAAVRVMLAFALARRPARADLSVAGEEVRFAARLSRRRGRAASDRVLGVGVGSSWIEVVKGSPILLDDAPMLRALVEALVRERERSPGASLTSAELAARIWPGTPWDAQTGNRLYVALARLRKMGLGDVIERTPRGFRVAPDAPLRRVDGPPR